MDLTGYWRDPQNGNKSFLEDRDKIDCKLKVLGGNFHPTSTL